ncbi:hypothetical protein ACSBM8_05405 [Sphingomonas sp. ASY06-1R]|uniref:hypothetical protein n=1 Tax=Sphingomonas sp. ASY06-1R TaxID=3445771 RepID=UPI003FA28CA4
MMTTCTELYALEAAAFDRVGGPIEADRRAIAAAERAIGNRRADSPEAMLWRAQRLARAVLNDWHAELVRPLALAVERDLVAFI